MTREAQENAGLQIDPGREGKWELHHIAGFSAMDLSLTKSSSFYVSSVGYLIIGGGRVFSLVFKLCIFMTETSA